LRIREEVLGAEHPSTALSLNNLAGVLWEQRDLVAARRLYERSLAIYEKMLDVDHPRTVATRQNLAALIARGG
jgi:predicted RNA binding protein with dsRBD fold (UPF0201 family)